MKKMLILQQKWKVKDTNEALKDSQDAIEQ